MTRQRKRTDRTDPTDRTALAALWARFLADRGEVERAALIDAQSYLVIKTRERVVPNVPFAIDVEDLISEGSIALIKSIDQFEPSRGVKFDSYAIAMIRGTMLEYLRKEDWVPRSVRTKQKRLAGAELALLEQGWPVSALALAAYLEMDLDEFRQFAAVARVWEVVYWDDVVADREWDDLDPLFRRDGQADTAPGPEAVLLERTQRLALWREVATLPAAYREVFRRYYVEGETLKVIAAGMERSESRAHQIHAHGLVRLRARDLAYLGIGP